MKTDHFKTPDFNRYAGLIYKNAKEKGFHDSEINIGQQLMLIVSELGEAMGAHRKGNFSLCRTFSKSERIGEFIGKDKNLETAYIRTFQLYVKDTFEDEIADAVIGLLDLAATKQIDLNWHIEKKMMYNSLRPHLHGKKY